MPELQGRLILTTAAVLEPITLADATWKLYLDSFPSIIHVPRPPLDSITSITYIDTGGTSQTLASSQYTVITEDQYDPQVREAYGLTWPSTRSQPNAVTVTFKSGYGANTTDVPEHLRQSILLLVGDLFALRETTVTGTIVARLPQLESLMNQRSLPALI